MSYRPFIHTYTVPNGEYGSKSEAIEELTRLGFQVKTKDVIIEGCEHHGIYHEVHIRLMEANE